MERTKNPLELPFLDCRAVVELFGGVIGRTTAYNMMHELLEKKDKDGKPLIDPERMPPTTKVMVPTDIFCKQYNIKRRVKRRVNESG